MNKYHIRVFQDGETGTAHIYTVFASDELSARCIAFILDGGTEPVQTWDKGHIELAKTWTEVVSVQPPEYQATAMCFGDPDAVLVGENSWNPPGIVFTIKNDKQLESFKALTNIFYEHQKKVYAIAAAAAKYDAYSIFQVVEVLKNVDFGDLTADDVVYGMSHHVEVYGSLFHPRINNKLDIPRWTKFVEWYNAIGRSEISEQTCLTDQNPGV